MVIGPRVADLLAARLRANGAAPLITYYDDETGERTELSAATFANWVAKTANLLVDGLGVHPGDSAVVALPLHWQSLVVVAGCAAAGVHVRWQGPAQVAFTAEKRAGPAGADDEVRLSLRPLGGGLRVPEPGVIDYAAEVRVHGDYFAGSSLRIGEIPGVPPTIVPDDRRLMVAPDGDPNIDGPLFTVSYLGLLVGTGSAVLCRHADRAALPARAQTERAYLPPHG